MTSKLQTSAEILAAAIEKDKAAGLNQPGMRVETHTPEPIVDSLSEWEIPVDLFSATIAQRFPVGALPHNFQQYAVALSKSSGFDVGAYCFDMLASASVLIDHRARMRISPSWEVPANAWWGKVAQSGGGKTPTMKAATAFIVDIDGDVLKESQRLYAKWAKDNEGVSKDEKEPPPDWKQRILNDVTIEAVGAMSRTNPEGLILIQDELTEFIGRMDAYTKGGSKDRGAYLRAYDGGNHVINRRSGSPLVIDNFSVGLIGGIQPEKLAELFKSSGGADGLYQRFMLYQMQPAGKIDFSAEIPAHTEDAVRHTYQRIHEWTVAGKIGDTRLSPSAMAEMQDYANHQRVIVARTPAKRFAEHLDKFPAMLGRITFTLHVMECAADDVYRTEVGIETFMRAKACISVLYRHSETVYAILDSTDTKRADLVKSVGEAILSKGWRVFGIRDLTQYATHWKDADIRLRESVIDSLIELDWIRDETPADLPGKRGRKSGGRFAVNPAVFILFQEHSARITTMRAERFASIQANAARKRGN